MRKSFMLITVIVLMFSTVLAAAFLAPIPIGEPMLDLEFAPDPPWHVRPGESVKINLTIVNNGWYFAVARGVRLQVVAPPGFTISGANTNEWNKDLQNMRGGEQKSSAITIAASLLPMPGNYTISASVFGENAPQKLLTSTLVIELPYIP